MPPSFESQWDRWSMSHNCLKVILLPIAWHTLKCQIPATQPLQLSDSDGIEYVVPPRVVHQFQYFQMAFVKYLALKRASTGRHLAIYLQSVDQRIDSELWRSPSDFFPLFVLCFALVLASASNLNWWTTTWLLSNLVVKMHSWSPHFTAGTSISWPSSNNPRSINTGGARVVLPQDIR